ncbi:MAG: TldD/PmbA family protein [Alphaproteobacteria bacterium]|nr:MAG: TldD/PmbA family protein [Alphaproteobacteria bacterium]
MANAAPGALSQSEKISLAEDLIKAAAQKGADAADALIYDSQALSSSVRLGKLENSERSEARDLGLRVIVGARQASVSTTDFSREGLKALAERAVAMARLAPEDPYCGLADTELLADQVMDLELADKVEPEAGQLIDEALAAEQAARDVEGVSNSLGAGAGWGRAEVAYVASNGFCGSYISTSHSLSCAALAGEGTGMERDSDGHSVRHLEDRDSAQAIGRSAGERAVAKLGPRKVASQAAPVVFSPRVSMTLLGAFAGAINGNAIARGTSFLRQEMGKAVFSADLCLIDDPHIKRGRGSRYFDGEGVATQKRVLVEDGQLTTWLLNTSAARQLDLTTTGHGARGTGGPPGISTSNLYMAPGKISPEALIGDIDQGLFVTGLIGQGTNLITGDYSRGANGFWIENGEIAYPVSEITIASNLKDMFLNMTAADDLEFRYGTNAPTLRVEGMTIAGA